MIKLIFNKHNRIIILLKRKKYLWMIKKKFKLINKKINFKF